MEIEREEFLIVVIGAFNPAIFHPAWFLRQGVIDEETSVSLNVSSKEVSQMQLGAINLTCVQDRLSLETGNLAYIERLLDITAAIFRLLPHIPLKACGINRTTFFRIKSNELWHKIGHTLAPKELIWDDLGKDPGMQRLDIKYPADEESLPGQFNVLILPPAQKKLEIRVNRHFNLETMNESEAFGMTREFLDSETTKVGEFLKKTAKLIETKILA